MLRPCTGAGVPRLGDPGPAVVNVDKVHEAQAQGLATLPGPPAVVGDIGSTVRCTTPGEELMPCSGSTISQPVARSGCPRPTGTRTTWCHSAAVASTMAAGASGRRLLY